MQSWPRDQKNINFDLLNLIESQTNFILSLSLQNCRLILTKYFEQQKHKIETMRRIGLMELLCRSKLQLI